MLIFVFVILLILFISMIFKAKCFMTTNPNQAHIFLNKFLLKILQFENALVN